MTTPTQAIVASAIATAKMIPAIALTPGNSLVRGPDLSLASDSIIRPEKGHEPRGPMQQPDARAQVPALQRAMEAGIMVGMVAAVPMGIFALIASAAIGHDGFFTPIYRVVSILDPAPLAASLQEAAFGSQFYVDQQPMFSGGAVHLAVGCFFGALFALAARRLRLHGPAALAAGVVYGLAVMTFMAFVGLPLVARVLGGGEVITGLPGDLGWPIFVVAHALYGLVLGVWILWRPGDLALATEPAPER
jgi:hypothetical protein